MDWKVTFLLAAMLCGCAAPAPQSTPKSPIAQRLASVPRVTPQVSPQVTPATFRTNVYKILYAINPTGHLWSLEASSDFKTWAAYTNWIAIGTDIAVFASNNVPRLFWRVRLY